MPNHFLEGKLVAETATTSQPFSIIFEREPLPSVRMSMWSWILASFRTGETFKISLFLVCSTGADILGTFSGSRIHNTPCQTEIA